jgi:hypothetical protein
MLIIFCILPFGCSGRHNNAVVETPETEITAFEAVNGQTFYGAVDFFRKPSLQQGSEKCTDFTITSIFGIFLQEETKTKSVKFRAYTENKDAIPLYNLSATKCDDTAIVGYYTINVPSGGNSADSLTTTIFDMIEQDTWESSLTLISSDSITDLTTTLSFSSQGAYYYIYPTNHEGSGVTLNILGDSILDTKYSKLSAESELDEENIESVTKLINLKIETTDGSYYATLDETYTPGSSQPTVSVDLFKDEAKTELINYQMVIDYSEHKIRFEKTSSND